MYAYKVSHDPLAPIFSGRDKSTLTMPLDDAARASSGLNNFFAPKLLCIKWTPGGRRAAS
jgi:hypothetical protein